MKKLTILATLLTPTLAFAAFDQCRDYFPNRTVPAIESFRPRLQDLCFDSFAVLHSGESKTPVYVVEKLNRARITDAGDEQRTDKFYAEARLPSADRAQLDDYKGSGYDRGHMAPAADMPTANAMAQSFSLANMVPQSPENNRGVWAKSVEKPVRQYVMRAAGDVFVFTGPVFADGAHGAVGSGKVWKPTHLYKLVYDQTAGKAFAYWIENTSDAHMSVPISYHELVQRVRIEFLPGVVLKSEPGVPTPVVPVKPVVSPFGVCYTGPKGGTYLIGPSGKKNYSGC